MLLKEVRQERAKLVAESRKIIEGADAEKRDLNPEEKSAFDAMMEKVDDLGNRVDQLEKLESAESEVEENDDEPEKDAPEKKDDAEEKSKRSAYLRKLEAEGKRSAGRYSSMSLEGGNLEARNNARYVKAYSNYLRSGHMPHEFRDMSLGTDASGGYLVTPVKLVEEIVTAVNNLVFIRELADVQKLTEAKSLGNPQLTTDIQAITWGDEVTVSAADTSIVLGRRDLTPIMATNLVKVSYRELQASARVEQLLAQRIALSFAYGEEQAYLTGSGSGQPLGVFIASASGVPTSRDVTATGASASIAFDDIKNMVYSIPQQYHNSPSFRWVLHRSAVKAIVKLKDSSGNYLWQVGGYQGGNVGRRPDTLDGIPVCMSEFAPSTFTTNSYIAVLGDFKYYRIAETMDMEIQRLNELYAASGQIGFLARKFLDGSPILPSAFSRLKLGS